MYYEINVSFNGVHLFATHERSLKDRDKANNLFNLFVQKFPVAKGYRVSLVQYRTSGEELQFT